MKNYRLRTISAVISCALLLAACTSNTGVATETTLPSDTANLGEAGTGTVDLSEQSVETVYGAQLPQYLNHQYYFEGEAVPLTESNFYFIDTFTELCRYAGYYYPATSEGYIDLSAVIDTTGMSEDMVQYNTYGDFFVSYSEQMLESGLIICKLANEEGLTLPEDTVAQIDELMNNIQQSADEAGLSADAYLSIYYGEGTTAEAFRQTISNYYLADVYTQEFIDNYEFDPEEITVPNIRYTLYQVAPGSSDEVSAAAEEAATALFDEAAGDLDTFTVEAALAYTNGETADYGDIGVPDDGSIDETFTEWAWDEARTEGEIGMFYSEGFGYFVVAYLGTTEIDQSAQDEIAVKRMSEIISDAIENDTYEFYTSDAFAPAPTAAPVESIQAGDFVGTVTDPTDVYQESAVGNLTGSKGLDVVLIILSVIGGVAVVGLAAIGVKQLAKGKEPAGKSDKKED